MKTQKHPLVNDQDLDIIGDIHGDASALIRLLGLLGYEKASGDAYRHPQGRTAIFVGDFIDRGSEIVQTLRIVRSMVEAGSGVALMGNHEYNLLCLHHLVDGTPLKPEDKYGEHTETIHQFSAAGEDLYYWLDWFRSLPLFLETDLIRVVHACWDATHIQVLRDRLPEGRLTPDLMNELVDRKSPLWRAVNCTLKGKEAELPAGQANGSRNSLRVKWWQISEVPTWSDVAFPNVQGPLAKQPFDFALLDTPWLYPDTEKPVFFGHYMLLKPLHLPARNICCLDFGVAYGHKLASYRFDGSPLNQKLLVSTEASF